MTTKNEKTSDDQDQIRDNDDLCPDAIIEEEFIGVIITDDDDQTMGDDSQTMGDNDQAMSADDLTAGVSAQQSTDQISSDPMMSGQSAPQMTEGMSSVVSEQAVTGSGKAGSEETNSEKPGSEKDKKDNTVDMARDGDKIEDLDDKVVSETNELIREKKNAQAQGGCGCGC